MHRTYPRPVVLRKGIILCVILGALLIMLLIIYNLYQSSKNKNFATMHGGSPVQSYASEADTNWYQNKSVKKASTEKPP